RGARLRARRRVAQPGGRIRVRTASDSTERHGSTLLQPTELPLRLEPALAPRLPARSARARRVRVAAASDPSGDLGLRRTDDGRDDALVPRRPPPGDARAPARRP